MSETKATKIIKRLLNNDLASSLLLAVSNNDEDAFKSALEDANLTMDDITLSQTEFDNLVKGVKPSGELDLATLEGYYVVTNQSQNDPLAFMILPGTDKDKVYWGTQSQVLANPNSHVVDHKITSDNKLEFSTPTHGPVSISLTRELDHDNGTGTVHFSGTCNGKDISGKKAPPPIKYLKLQGRFKRQATAPRASNATTAINSSPWYNNPITLSTTTIFGLLGGLTAIIQILLWVKAVRGWQKERRAKQMKEELTRQEESTTEIAEDSYPGPRVDYPPEGAREAIDNSITDHINQTLETSPPDYQNMTPDEIAESHEVNARQAATAALRGFITRHIMPDVRKFMEKFSAIPNFDDVVDSFGRRVVGELVASKMDQFNTFKSAVLPLVLEARKAFFYQNYATTEDHLGSVEQDLADSKARREAKQSEVAQVAKKIQEYEKAEEEEEAKKAREEKEKLEEEVKVAEEEEREKQQERDQAERAMGEARSRKEEAESKAEHDNSKEEWDHKMKDVFAK